MNTLVRRIEGWVWTGY